MFKIGVAISLLAIAGPCLSQAPAPVMTVERALEIGYERNFRVRRSERFLDIADARVKSTAAALGPRADSYIFTSHGTRMNIPSRGNGFSPQFAPFASATVTQPIDIGGQLGRQKKQAELSRTNSELELNNARSDLEYEIRAAFLGAQRTAAVLRIEQTLQTEAEALLKKIDGRVPQDMLAFLRLETSNNRQVVASAQSADDGARDTLLQTMRQPLQTPIKLPPLQVAEYPTPTFERAIEQAETNRPELRQARLRIEQTRLSIEQATDHRRPQVGIQAFASQGLIGTSLSSAKDRGSFGDRGIRLTAYIPLAFYDGGQTVQNERVALTLASQAEDDLAEHQERLTADVRQSVVGLLRAVDRQKSLPDLNVARQAMATATNALLTSGSGHSGALAQWSNARSVLRNTELAIAEVTADVHFAWLRYNRSIGYFAGNKDARQ